MIQADALAMLELVRQAVRAELQVALAPLLPPALDRRQVELLQALQAVVGGTPFTSTEALELARLPVGDRPRLKAALTAAGAVDAHKAGMVLAGIAKRSTGLPTRLVRAGRECGSGLWRIESGAAGA